MLVLLNILSNMVPYYNYRILAYNNFIFTLAHDFITLPTLFLKSELFSVITISEKMPKPHL